MQYFLLSFTFPGQETVRSSQRGKIKSLPPPPPPLTSSAVSPSSPPHYTSLPAAIAQEWSNEARFLRLLLPLPLPSTIAAATAVFAKLHQRDERRGKRGKTVRVSQRVHIALCPSWSCLSHILQEVLAAKKGDGGLSFLLRWFSSSSLAPSFLLSSLIRMGENCLSHSSALPLPPPPLSSVC